MSRLIRLAIAVCGAVLISTVAKAATFRVDANGTIGTVNSALSNAPFSVGGSVNLTFTYSSQADRIVDNGPAMSPGANIIYFGVVSELVVDWGGFEAILDPNPSLFEQRVVNKITVNDNLPVGTSLGPLPRDAVFLDQAIVGANSDTFESARVSINMQNIGGTMYDSTALNGSLFTNEAISASNERAQFVIALDGIGTSVASINSFSTTEISAVPLPATGLLLIAGLGTFAAFRRRAC